MKKIRFIALCSLVAFISCSTPVTKKILIMGRGKITAKDNNITMTGLSGSIEESVDINSDEAVTWNVTSPSGNTTVNIPGEKGFYIFNLKADTIVGSQQMMGKDLGGRTISQEELRKNIDSLTKLTSGANVSAAAHNYIITPNQLVKVSANTEVKVFGPFTKIPGTLEANKDGSAPEIYKFYTNTEVRELIEKLKKMTY